MIRRFDFSGVYKAALIFGVLLLSTGRIYAQVDIINETFRNGLLPSGWSQTDVTLETTADGYARFSSTSAVLTSPTIDLTGYTDVNMTFYVAKFSSGGDGPLTVEISSDGGSSWTAQSFDSPTPSNDGYLTSGPTTITVTGSNVRIRIIRTNSPSQKRFRDLILEGTPVPTCSTPSQITFDNAPSLVTQSAPFGMDVAVRCADGVLSDCNTGQITINSTACGLEGTLTQPVVNGLATFTDLQITRSTQDDVTFTASYSGACGVFSATTGAFDVLEPVPGGILAQQNYEDPSTWDSEITNIGNLGVFNSSNSVGYSGAGLAYFADDCSPGDDNVSSSTVTYEKTALAGYSGLKFKFRMAVRGSAIPGFETGCSGGGGIDTGEKIELHVSINGGPFVRTFILNGFSNGSYPFNNNLIALNHNSNTSYNISSASPSNFSVSIPENTNSVSLRFTLESNRNEEVIILDNLVLEAEEGTEPSPLPSADAGADFTGCNGGPNDLSVGLSNALGPVTYEWSPASGIAGSTSNQTAEAINTSTQTYTLTATDEDGCAAVDEVTVTIPSGPAGTWTDGLGNSNWFDCRNWADGKVPTVNTDVIIPAGSSDPQIEDEPYAALCGDLNIGNGRSIVVDGDPELSLEVHGDISGAGGIEILIGQLIFGGSQSQTIGTDVDIRTWGLIIDKPENYIESQASIDVNCEEYSGFCATVLLESGVIKFSESKKLIIGEGTDISEGSAISFVDGIIRKQGYEGGTEVIFPTGVLDLGSIGSADDVLIFQPASLTTEADNATAIFELQYFHENYNTGFPDPSNPPTLGLNNVSTCNYWNIDRVEGSLNAKVGLSWNQDNDCFEVNDPDALTVARFNDLAIEWEDAPIAPGVVQNNSGAPSFTSGWVRTTATVNNFSPFAVGSIGSDLNVLPIELIAFTAKAIDQQTVATKWTTASETNNDFFTIERSGPALDFKPIGTIKGAGNSNTTLNYDYVDDAPFTGVSYYRLKQTDFDGSFAYSPVQAVHIDLNEEPFGLNLVYRADTGVKLEYEAEAPYLKVEIFDLSGRLIFADTIENGGRSALVQPLLSSGIYMLRLSDKKSSSTLRFFY